MQQNELPISGAVVFWTPAKRVSRERLRDALAPRWTRTLPEPRPASACLKDALKQTFPDGMVRRLKDKDAFIVKEEIRGDDDNDYLTVGGAAVDEHGTVSFHFKTQDDKRDQVRQQHETQLGLLTGASVTKTLVKILECLGSTTLRPSGGLYWLPEEHIDEWRKLAAHVESTATEGEFTIFLLPVAKGEDAAKAVLHAIRDEVERESAALLADVADVGTRGLENRKRACCELSAKIGRYEGMLGVSLQTLLQRCEQVNQVIVTAGLQLAVEADENTLALV